MTEYTYEKDESGIVTVTLDATGASANTMTEAWLLGMEELGPRLEAEEDLTGIVIASAKKTFFAGGNLDEILEMSDTEAAMAQVTRTKAALRKIEKLPVPMVAAINGAALGGGYEICLLCNRRIVVDSPKAVVGLPEVTLGLLPGAGGVVRLTALIGLEAALPNLLEGKQVRPAQAVKAGMVDEIVATQEDLIPAAKAWIKANPDAGIQPWDQRGFVPPGGDANSPRVRGVISTTPAMLYNKTRGLMPAPEKILDIAVNSLRMGFESAMRAESRGFAALAVSPEAKAAIRTFFFGFQDIKAGKARPKDHDRWQATSSAVLGAGMMGAGIAWAHAKSKLPTLLKDTQLEAAERGKAYSERLAKGQIKRGRMTQDAADALLSQITPTASDDDIEKVDVIVEAVFEDIALKEKVIADTFSKLSDDGIYGSNTSTLPISILAEACPDPTRFIGLHFFSPVDKMRIVEIIVGEKTSDATLAKAYDYVLQIGYTPIVVNDSRGFFTSRVFGTYLDEGQALMRDGVSAVAVERCSWTAGMPVGPLAVFDEVSMALAQKVKETHEMLDARLGVENGFPADNSSTHKVGIALHEMGRSGRLAGAGFYDYAEDGSKSLWPGLKDFAERNIDVPKADIEDRMIYRQVIETLKCRHEGVLHSSNDGNIGSILAIGFPAYAGGALEYVNLVGKEKFAARCSELAERYGARFHLDPALLEQV